MKFRFTAYALSALFFAAISTLSVTSAQAQLGGKRNSDQPIDITSDSLEVVQEKHFAIFKGNVEAIQGDIRLRSDQLKVYYRDRNEQKPAQPPARGAKPAAQQNNDTGTGSITKIEATGRVFISSPEETAQGSSGVYDTETRTVVLTGDVVITRGQNIIRGTKAVMNLDSGRSDMEAGPGGRVRAMFVPEKKKE